MAPDARTVRTLLVLLAALAGGGCSSKPTFEGAHLAGAVTIDGQPVREGKLAFIPTGSARGPAVGAVIVAGRYDCPRVPLGNSQVQVYALRPTGKKVAVMGTTIPEMVNIVPKQDRGGIGIQVTGDNLSQDFALGSVAQ